MEERRGGFGTGVLPSVLRKTVCGGKGGEPAWEDGQKASDGPGKNRETWAWQLQLKSKAKIQSK